jgi:hypothetical protein
VYGALAIGSVLSFRLSGCHAVPEVFEDAGQRVGRAGLSGLLGGFGSAGGDGGDGGVLEVVSDLGEDVEVIDESRTFWNDSEFSVLEVFAEADGLEGFEFLEGALEGAFGAAGVEVDAFEALGEVTGEQRVSAAAGGVGLGGDFGATAAAEAPGGVGVLGEELAFEGAGGLDLVAESGDELFELLVLAVEDDEVLGAEAVAGGVAFVGAGAGGTGGVGLVGGELSGGSHGGGPFWSWL